MLNVEIIITEDAAKKIDERTAGRDGYLKLVYDTDGCGWAVNGVAALWFTGDIDQDEIEINTNNRSVYIEKQKLVFFDEQMKIDFSSSSNTFQLKSPQQILNSHMSFVIKEKTDWSRDGQSVLICILSVFIQKLVYNSFVVVRIFIQSCSMDAIFRNIQHFWTFLLLE